MLGEHGGAVTVADVVDRLGGHPNAARGHLSVLVGEGLALRVPSRETGRRGRPAATFRISEAGRRLLARETSPVGARQQVVWLLDRLGFSPLEGDGDVVRLRTCPLLEQARMSPETVCRVHRDLVADTLRAHGAGDEGVVLEPFAEPGACRLVLPSS